MKRSTIFWIVVSLAVVLLLGYRIYLRTRPPAEEPPYSGPVEKITIANIGEFSILNLIAEDKGYFAHEGLDATIDEYDSGATSIAALLSGKADVAIAADVVGMTNMFISEDLRVLAVVSHHEVFRLVARRDKGIIRPLDLEGKTIGVTRRTAGEFYLGLFLALNGLRFEDVQLVDLPPAGMVNGLKVGELDAVLIFDPHAYALEEEMKGEVVAWSAQEGQHALGLAYAMRPFIDRHPDVVARYLRALVRAERYVRENDAAARAFVAGKLGYSDAYVRYLWPKFQFAVRLDQDVLLALEDQARWAISAGLTDKRTVPNYLDRIHFPGLESVNPDAVTIVH